MSLSNSSSLLSIAPVLDPLTDNTSGEERSSLIRG